MKRYLSIAVMVELEVVILQAALQLKVAAPKALASARPQLVESESPTLIALRLGCYPCCCRSI